MRFKVRTGTTEAYERVERLLEDRNVKVFVRSPKRRYVSTEELPGEVRSEIQTFGADITPEVQYSPD